MAAEIASVFGVEAALIAEGRGIFDVKVDGDLIYSKYVTGCFPEHEEIMESIRAICGASD